MEWTDLPGPQALEKYVSSGVARGLTPGAEMGTKNPGAKSWVEVNTALRWGTWTKNDPVSLLGSWDESVYIPHWLFC